jgi:alkaline phosphatase D
MKGIPGMKRLLQRLLAASIFSISLAHAQQITPVIDTGNPPNTPAQQAKHYVILVSLDGFRFDYPAKYGAPHIQSMAKDGASAPEGMLPSYPSLTFPNHLSLVTGLYPEHHGIVANSFYDPARNDTYVYTQPKSNGDGTWYSGTPLWSLAEQQGMRSACLFWPGSEAEIAGKRPSYYLKFDNKLDDKKRVEQVLAWLALPPEQRPHFITLYYANVDHEGHEHGPDSDEVRDAVHHVDEMIGDLQAGIAASKLPVDLIVVADHGMVALKGDIDLSTFADLSGVHTEGSLIYAKDEAQAEKIYEQFKAHPDPRFTVYRRAEVPSHLHYNASPREGDPVVVPNGPYALHTKPLTFSGTMDGKLRGGHGFDPRAMPEMRAIFFADGPDIKPNIQFAPFRNVDIYPFVGQLLGLTSPPVDGSIKVLVPALVDFPSALASSFSSDTPPLQVGGGVTPPVLLHQVEAEYSKEARKAKLSGVVLVGLILEKDGTPSHVHVVKGIGHGLDENAVEAIKQYKFKPSTLNGEPVRVEMNVQVDFRIFKKPW